MVINICELCGKSYTSVRNLKCHIRICHKNIRYNCKQCNFNFTRLSNLKLHIETVGGQNQCRINVIRQRAIQALPSTATTSITSAAAVPSAPTTIATTATATISPSTITSAAAVTPTVSTTIASICAPPSSATSTSAAPSTSSTSTATAPSTSSTSTATETSSGLTTTTTIDHGTLYHYCLECREYVSLKHWSYHLRTNAHKKNSGAQQVTNTNNNINNITSIRSAFKERIETLLIKNKYEEELRAENFLKTVEVPLLTTIDDMIVKHGSIKWNIELFKEYIKCAKTENDAHHDGNDVDDDDDQILFDIKSHQTKMVPSFQTTNIAHQYEKMCTDILAKMSEFQERDSGWTLIKILHIEVNMNQYKPLVGGTYIPLPTPLFNKRACLNVQNNDNYCFKWAMISSLINVSNPSRCRSYGVVNIGSDVITLNITNNNNISSSNINNISNSTINNISSTTINNISSSTINNISSNNNSNNSNISNITNNNNQCCHFGRFFPGIYAL